MTAASGELAPGELEHLLDRTARRLALGDRFARAAWLALGALGSVEVGALAARGVGSPALVVGEALGAVLGLAALGALLRGASPTASEAARAVDRTLGQGALVETAAEALAGRHGAFAGLAVIEARRASAGLSPAVVAPLETPRGLWLGGGAILLLLALALGPASEAAPAPVEGPEVVVEAGPAAGPETPGKPGATPRPTGSPDNLVVRPGTPGDGSKPADSPRLTPDQARALATRLAEIVPLLKARGGEPSAEERNALDAFKDAVAKGDAGKARRALDELGARGTRGSADELAKAADALRDSGRESGTGESKKGEGETGAGQGTPGATPSPSIARSPGERPTAPDLPGRTPDGVTARELVSPRVRAAEKRYLAALEESRGGG